MSSIKFLLLFLLLVCGVAQANQDDDFLAARDAFRAGDAAKLTMYANRLQNSPLEVYTAYYQLRMQLDTATTEQVQVFLARPNDTPLIDRLRAEWLKSLGKTQQWELFDKEYSKLINDDSQLHCYFMQSGLRTQQQAILHQVHDLWLTTDDVSESCAVLFETAITAGSISGQEIWQKMQQALQTDNILLARSLINLLPGHPVSSKMLDLTIENPVKFLKKPLLTNKFQRAMSLFALQRLARLSCDLASAQWTGLSPHFSVDEQHYFFGRLGYEAARKHDPRAVEWFKLAGDTPLNAQQAAWRVRAALREQNWTNVLSYIDAMSPAQRKESCWQYWRARALLAAGKRKDAQLIFVPLSAESTFYGQLAEQELGDTPVLSAVTQDFQPGEQELLDMEKFPGVQRTIALYRMNLRTDALREWSWLVRNFNDKELLTAAEIARRHEMYDRAINTAERTVQIHDFSLRYLAPYRKAMSEYIRENNLDESWVYGLMRQESRFVTSARSGVGAAGLMQIMPSTARWIAKKLGLKDYSLSLLHQLDTNLKMGTYYMKNMLSSLDNSPVLASAAYNAGRSRALRWRADTPLEGAIYIETIPFEETRDYVKKVMSNTVYYAQQFGEPPRSLKMRLGIISGKTDDKAATLLDRESP
jgi:soluble lytic murein transglycosylase